MIFSDTVLFFYALISTFLMIFLLIYFVITLTDLECDYLNSIDCCSKLNFWTWPKTIGQLVTSVLLVLHAKWSFAVFNSLLSAWYVWQLVRVPSGNFGIYDPTEINSGQRYKKHMRDSLIQIGCYLVLFFFYITCVLVALMEGDDLPKDEDNFITENPMSLNQKIVGA